MEGMKPRVIVRRENGVESLYGSPVTHLRFKVGEHRVEIKITSSTSRRHRKLFALTMLKLARIYLTGLKGAFLYHEDSHTRSVNRDVEVYLQTETVPDLSRINGTQGFRIRARRLEMGLSQEALSRLSGISRSHLSKVEQGKVKIRDSTLKRLDLMLQFKQKLRGKLTAARVTVPQVSVSQLQSQPFVSDLVFASKLISISQLAPQHLVQSVLTRLVARHPSTAPPFREAWPGPH